MLKFKQLIYSLSFLFILFTTSAMAEGPKKQNRPKKPLITIDQQYVEVPSLSTNLYLITGKVPLARIGKRVLKANLTLGSRQSDDDSFPKDLYRVGAGLSLQNRTDRFELKINSASNKPFNSKDEISWMLMGSKEAKHWEHSSLNLGVFYTNRFQYPLPAITWVYISPKMQIIVGFPILKFGYQLNSKDRLHFDYKPIQDIDFGLTRSFDGFNAGINGVIESDRYLIADRRDKDNTLVLETTSIRLHADKTYGDNWKLVAMGGYIVSSRTYVGENMFSINSSSTLGSGWIAGLRLDYIR